MLRKLFPVKVLRVISPAVALAVAAFSTGCSTIFSGSSQTVLVTTAPAGRTVYYEGMPVRDGEYLVVQKRFEAPQMNIGNDERQYLVPMAYGPDPWLIGDAVLMFVFLVPGLVAVGVDLGTGSWRKLESPQRFHVGAISANRPAPPEEDERPRARRDRMR